MKKTEKKEFQAVDEASELRRRLARLEAENELWRRTFDAIPDLVATIDADSRIISVNGAMALRLGLSREECVGRFCFEVVHGTDRPPACCPHAQLLHDGLEHAVEVHEERLGGDFLLTASPVRDADGRLLCCTHVARDVTALKKTEDALKNSEFHLSQAMDMARLAYWEADGEADVFILNDACYRLIGSTAEKEGGYAVPMERYLRKYIHPDDLPMVLRFLEDARIAGVPGELPDVEARIVRGDGEVRHILARVRVTRSQDGRVRAFGINQDITDRKRTEEALLESETKYRTTVESSLAGVYIYQDGLFRFVNKRFSEIYGYPREDIVDRLGPRDVAYPDERNFVLKQVDACLSGKSDRLALVHRVVRQDGATIMADVLGSLTTYKGRPAICGTVLDITEQQRTQEELRQKTALLEALVNASLDGITVVDKGRMVLQNEQARRLLMVPPEVAESVDDRVELEWIEGIVRDPEGYREKLAHLAAHPLETFRNELELKDGTVLDTYASPAIGRDGTDFGRVWAARDVTERRRSEEALRTSQLQLSEAADLAHIVYWEADPGDDVLVLNDAVYAFHGTTAAEEGGYRMALEEYARRFVHPDDRRPFFGRKGQITSQPDLLTADLEFRIVRRDGDVRNVLARMRIVKDETGRIVKRYGIDQDITDQRQMELALLESKKRYRELVESANSIILRLDGAANVVFINEFAQRFFGYREDEIIGRNVVGTIVPEAESTGRSLRSMFGDMLSKPERYESNVNENMRRNGERVWVAWANRFAFDDAGNIRDITCVGNDITERKLAEAALEESEAKFRDLAEKSLVGIYLIQDGLFRYVNSKFAETLGYAVEEIVDRMGPKDTTFPEDWPLVEEGLQRRMAGDAVAGNYLFRVSTRNREVRQAEVYSSHTTYRGRAAVIGTFLDVTERLNLQSQLNQAQKMESLGRLAGGVAHDFNNMLTVILGHAEMAMMRSDLSGEPHASFQIIQETALRSASLVRQLLAFARKQTIAPKVLDLNDTMAGMLKMLRRLTGEDIDFKWTRGASLWPVRMDPSQIDQILANLCVNARDAIAGVGRITMETGNVTFDAAYCSLNVGTVPGEYVMLAVSDNGCGMDKETSAKIFEPFFTTKETGKGTGLGLATVYGIVKQNGGFVSVYSEPGVGSTFKVYLPRFHGEPATAPPETAPEPPRGEGETILLVEDVKVVLTVAKYMLEHLGYRVIAAPTPTEAIEIAKGRGEEIDLLITDLVMPEMNGKDLSTLLVKMIPGLKCLFVSGYTADAIAHHGILDEGVNFLEKPFSVQGLAHKVREALGRS
jgi:PAS domain S-box-containing protein